MVVEIGEAQDGGIDCNELQKVLNSASNFTRKICSFSAASNITGIMADVKGITKIPKDAGALIIWDYAGGAPYMPIEMCPAEDAEIDAIALSPHKLVGSPAASGVLIVKREAVVVDRPVLPGGGTVTLYPLISRLHEFA